MKTEQNGKEWARRDDYLAANTVTEWTTSKYELAEFPSFTTHHTTMNHKTSTLGVTQERDNTKLAN